MGSPLGKPGDITALPSGMAVEATAPQPYRRMIQIGELDIQHAAFLIWASQDAHDRNALLIAKVLDREGSRIRRWRVKYGWEERLGDDAAQWAARLLQAMYPTLLPIIADTTLHFSVPTARQVEVARATIAMIEHEERASSASVIPVASPDRQPIPDPAPIPAVATMPAVSKAQRDADRITQIVDAGLALLGRGITKNEVPPPRWSDLPNLIKAKRLLEERPTEIVGVMQPAHAAPIESIRVQKAKASGDANAVLKALRDDAVELTVLLNGLLARAEAGEDAANLIVFPAAIP